jgi:hypothetical protein
MPKRSLSRWSRQRKRTTPPPLPLIANRYCRAPRPTLPAINLPLPTNPADAARVVVKAASSDDTIAVELASA